MSQEHKSSQMLRDFKEWLAEQKEAEYREVNIHPDQTELERELLEHVCINIRQSVNKRYDALTIASGKVPTEDIKYFQQYLSAKSNRLVYKENRVDIPPHERKLLLGLNKEGEEKQADRWMNFVDFQYQQEWYKMREKLFLKYGFQREWTPEMRADMKRDQEQMIKELQEKYSGVDRREKYNSSGNDKLKLITGDDPERGFLGATQNGQHDARITDKERQMYRDLTYEKVRKGLEEVFYPQQQDSSGNDRKITLYMYGRKSKEMWDKALRESMQELLTSEAGGGNPNETKDTLSSPSARDFIVATEAGPSNNDGDVPGVGGTAFTVKFKSSGLTIPWLENPRLWWPPMRAVAQRYKNNRLKQRLKNRAWTLAAYKHVLRIFWNGYLAYPTATGEGQTHEQIELTKLGTKEWRTWWSVPLQLLDKSERYQRLVTSIASTANDPVPANQTAKGQKLCLCALAVAKKRKYRHDIL